MSHLVTLPDDEAPSEPTREDSVGDEAGAGRASGSGAASRTIIESGVGVAAPKNPSEPRSDSATIVERIASAGIGWLMR